MGYGELLPMILVPFALKYGVRQGNDLRHEEWVKTYGSTFKYEGLFGVYSCAH